MLDGIAGNYEGHRFDFPGGWASDKRNAFKSEGRTSQENEIFEYARKLLNYRKLNTVLQSGKMKQFIPYDGIYVYFRYNDSKTIMVIANNNRIEKTFGLDRFNEMLVGKSKATDIINKAELDINKQVIIPPKTVLIFEIK
jgi:glycosidase